jgi:hypothetical protein
MRSSPRGDDRGYVAKTVRTDGPSSVGEGSSVIDLLNEAPTSRFHRRGPGEDGGDLATVLL